MIIELTLAATVNSRSSGLNAVSLHPSLNAFSNNPGEQNRYSLTPKNILNS